MAAPTVWKAQSQVNDPDTDHSMDSGGYDQRAAKVVGLANGWFAVAWEDGADRTQGGSPDIVGRLYNALGEPVGGALGQPFGSEIVFSPSNDEEQANVDLAAYGDFFLSAFQTNSGLDAFTHVEIDLRSNDDGRYSNGGMFYQGNNTFAPSVATFRDGYALVYQDDKSGSTDLKYIHVTGSRGEPPAVVDIAKDAGTPDIAALSNGNVVVAYEKGGDVALKIVTAAGAAVASSMAAATAATETDIVVAALPNGFVAAWSDGAGDVSFALYDNAGVRTLGPSDANRTTTAGVQDQPAVLALGDGGFMVAWRDAVSGDIEGQRFNASGAASGGEVTLLTGGDCQAPQLTLLTDGRFAVVADVREANGSRGVVSAIWDPRVGPVIGTDKAEELTAQLTGSTISGLGGNDTLNGSAAADTLDGGSGLDVMRGGAGSDIYYVDDVNDRVIDAKAPGVDIVYASVSFSVVGQFVENLTLTGTGDIDASGNTLKNILTGNSGDNVLNGGAGADTMAGGAGSDTYYVDDVGDKVIEADGAGVDSVYSWISFSLAGLFVENLTLTGYNGDATGNAMKNALTGDRGNNVLDGGADADVMRGGAGSDIYYVDNAADQVIEDRVAGLDHVFSSVSFVLGPFTENLTLTGTGDIDATGNASRNVLKGNAGANTLNGDIGADTLTGGTGADSFVFSTALAASNVDRITDLSHRDDTIRLDDAVFTGLAAGKLAAVAFWGGAGVVAAHDASDRIIYDTTSGALYFDRDGTGATYAAVQFATLTNHPADVSNTDFLVF